MVVEVVLPTVGGQSLWVVRDDLCFLTVVFLAGGWGCGCSISSSRGAITNSSSDGSGVTHRCRPVTHVIGKYLSTSRGYV